MSMLNILNVNYKINVSIECFHFSRVHFSEIDLFYFVDLSK